MKKERRGHHRLRTGRVSHPGQTYLITTVVRDRRPIFRDWQLASTAARATIEPLVLGQSRLLAWVLMPDHFHGLLQLGEDATLATVMQRFKGNTAIRVNRLLKVAGPLWQRGYHDHAMRKDEDLETMARYVVGNPVRAGLVNRTGEYPFWNAEWL